MHSPARSLCAAPAGTLVGSAVVAVALSSWPGLGDARERSAAAVDPCDQILEDARAASSLAALGQRLGQRQFELGSLERCRSQLERDPAIQRLAADAQRDLARQHESVVQRERARLQRPAEQLEANQVVMQARQDAIQAASQLTASMAMSAGAVDPHALDDPTAGETWPEPSYDEVPEIATVTPSPVVPGAPVVITGAQFGHQPGSVRITIQGETFNATVQDWSDTGINAFLGDSVTGVPPSDAAVLRVRRHQGATVTHNVAFQPVMEIDLLSSVRTVTGTDNDSGNAAQNFVSGLFATAADLTGVVMPTVRTRTVFSGRSVANHWTVSDLWIDTQQSGFYDGGGCEHAGPPTASAGGHQLATAVKLTSPVGTTVSCTVFVEVVGPRGVDHGVGDLRAGQ